MEARRRLLLMFASADFCSSSNSDVNTGIVRSWINHTTLVPFERIKGDKSDLFQYSYT